MNVPGAEVSIVEGVQLPVIPSGEVLASGGGVLPWQILKTGEKSIVFLGSTVIVSDCGFAQAEDGVKTCVVVVATVVFTVGGAHVPGIPFGEVPGRL